MIKGIIFDMDGVIIDSEPIHIKLENELFSKLGFSISEEEHNTFIGASSFYMWRKIKDKFNLTYTVEELVKMDRENYLNYITKTGDITFVKGVKEVIKNIPKDKYKLAVASSSPIEVIDLVVRKLNLIKTFDVLISGDFVRNSKPAPDIFLYTAEKLGLESSECVVIEDSKNGILGAKSAGMSVIGFLNKNSGNQDLSSADVIIESFNINLIEIIKKL
ncbi:MAG: HAD family hydrolase [Thermoanaerobacteraceae bacterium]